MNKTNKNENFKSRESMCIALAAAIDKEKTRLNSENVFISQEILASYFGVTKQRINQIIQKYDLHDFIMEHANYSIVEILKKIDTSGFTSFRLKKHLDFPFTEYYLRKLLQHNNLPYIRTDLQALQEGLIDEKEYEVLKRKKKIHKSAKNITSDIYTKVKQTKYKLNTSPQTKQSLVKRDGIITSI